MNLISLSQSTRSVALLVATLVVTACGEFNGNPAVNSLAAEAGDAVESLADSASSSDASATSTSLRSENTVASNAAPTPSVVPGGLPTAGTPVGSYNNLKSRFDDLLSRRSSWYSSANGAPCADPIDAARMTVVDGYNRLPAFDGLHAAFLATGDQSYINHMWSLSTEYMDSGSDRDGDGHLDWTTCYRSEGINHDHYEWRAAAGPAILLITLIDYPALAASTQANIDRLAVFLRDHVWNKWQPGVVPNERNNIYSSGSEDVSRIGFIAMALSKRFPEDPAYPDWLNNRAAELASMVRNHPIGANACNIRGRTNGTDEVGSLAPGSSDVSHASSIPLFLRAALEQGYSFVNSSDMQCLANTFNYVIWNGAGFHQNVNGTGPVDNFIARNISMWFSVMPYDLSYRDHYANWALNPTTFNSITEEAQMSVFAHLMRASMQ